MRTGGFEATRTRVVNKNIGNVIGRGEPLRVPPMPRPLSYRGSSVAGARRAISHLRRPEERARECISATELATAEEQRSDRSEKHFEGYPIGKRMVDVFLILLTLPLWAPLMLLIAVWIRLVSDAPVFFEQERIGSGRLPFTIMKFRSMQADADPAIHEEHVLELMASDKPLRKLDLEGDSRLIPGGFTMRALGLDELPQLFNVLSGEMSIVGPRPCTPGEFEKYSESQRERFNVVPGLTGYWQVNAKNWTTFTQMVEMDISYCRNQSPVLDLAISLQTLPTIFMQFVEAKLRLARRKRD